MNVWYSKRTGDVLSEFTPFQAMQIEEWLTKLRQSVYAVPPEVIRWHEGLKVALMDAPVGRGKGT